MLRERGEQAVAEGFVVACCFARETGALAFATGEGEVHVLPAGRPIAERIVATPHDGAVLCLAPDVPSAAGGGGFLSGGDDNALCRVGADGSTAVLAKGRRWVGAVASFGGRGCDAPIAAANGRTLELRAADGTLLRALEHDTTVSGVSYDNKGKRVAASHYNGASLWFTGARSGGTARKLGWKGSHLAVVLHPDGEALVTAMQENELHGWRLSDDHNMRMSGYPSKTESLAFSRNGRWLATSGAEVVVLWPFFGGGPMGKAPTELVGVPDSLCTRVAFHPQHDIVAAGFADGTVLMSDVATKRVLPICGGDPARGRITALGFSPDGTRLAFGSEQGLMAVVDLSKR
ncbi:MAG: WD40 repeat domain-containing protein [Gluconacetobacter diazotrophicus]|nr:WD40 repeat domain-containing protein [Gluconacetobacter diazotrophicus]